MLIRNLQLLIKGLTECRTGCWHRWMLSSRRCRLKWSTKTTELKGECVAVKVTSRSNGNLMVCLRKWMSWVFCSQGLRKSRCLSSKPSRWLCICQYQKRFNLSSPRLTHCKSKYWTSKIRKQRKSSPSSNRKTGKFLICIPSLIWRPRLRIWPRFISKNKWASSH